jgi:hypothetical protein
MKSVLSKLVSLCFMFSRSVPCRAVVLRLLKEGMMCEVFLSYYCTCSVTARLDLLPIVIGFCDRVRVQNGFMVKNLKEKRRFHSCETYVLLYCKSFTKMSKYTPPPPPPKAMMNNLKGGRGREREREEILESSLLMKLVESYV